MPVLRRFTGNQRLSKHKHQLWRVDGGRSRGLDFFFFFKDAVERRVLTYLLNFIKDFAL